MASPSTVYPFPCHVKPSSFVSIKLSGLNNYLPWRRQMAGLLKCFELYGFIDGTIPPEPQRDDWIRLNALVEGWIFSSLTKDDMTTVIGYRSAQNIWKRLEDDYYLAARSLAPVSAANSYANINNYPRYFELCTSIRNRDWEKTKTFLKDNRVAMCYPLNFITDQDGNNILHLTARLAPSHRLCMVNAAVLQMQRELQWFEEVRNLLRPEKREMRNRNKETPSMVFSREHKNLRQKGEDWMRKTAQTCSIICVLFIIIAFAATITAPGGNIRETGQTIYRKNPCFIAYIVSVVVSFVTSITSFLYFTAILMERFADEDFLFKLPKLLLGGFVMLFISMISLLVASGATLCLMFEEDYPLVIIRIATLTCLPVAIFARLWSPLIVDLMYSTYGKIKLE